MSCTPHAFARSRLSRLAKPPSADRLTRRRAVRGDVALQHRHEPLAVGRVAGLDHEIEDQAAPAGAQVELVTVLDVAVALDDDVGMRLEQADQLLLRRHRLAVQHPPLALRDHALDQRLIVADLGPPEGDRRIRRPGKPRRGVAQIGQGRARDLDQRAVERHPFWPSRVNSMACHRLLAARR